ncbi:unnamed protein product [Staurois parvus]|uniref:Secreted protein n=2 Tax=Staurois parvus TaxID=386267 RepID=A0ABN9C2M2_9NEOB|nr:unnamed protein product [Staurois parvus]
MVLLQPAYVVAAAPLHRTLTCCSGTQFSRGPLGSAPSPVIGRLCAFPELQFWRPITGEEAEPSSRTNIQWPN